MGDKTGSDLMNMAKMFMPKTGKDAGTAASGTSVDSDGNASGSSIGNWDRRYSFGAPTKGVGGEAAPLGGTSIADYLAAKENDPYSFTPAQSVADRFGDWSF